MLPRIKFAGFWFQICFTLLFALWLISPVSAGSVPNQHDQSCFSTLWPHERSDLQPDPSLEYGRLENGFRYAVRHNEVPKNRVAIYLNVQAGSINEEEEERGFAHFLEHMQFNGSRHFEPGELIEYFQTIGMNYGADTNAYTTYGETVYTLVLPEGNKEQLQKGFLIMSDFAEGALLLPSEVAKEKGVIRAEKLTRDSVDYRTHVATTKNSFQGTLLASRQPIGIEKTLKDADSKALRAFYRKWYRPENMILVVVGEVDVDEVVGLIEDTFTEIRGKGQQPACPDIGDISRQGLHSFYHYEPESGNTRIAIESYWNKSPQNDSYELQVENLKEYLATSILQKRLQLIEEQQVGLITNPRAYAGNMFDRIGYSGLAAETDPDHWGEALIVLENSLRQLVDYGVAAEELDLAKEEVLEYFAGEAQRAESRPSTHLARRLVNSLNNNRVFQSPLQEKNLYVPAIEKITVTDINRTIKKLFTQNNRLVAITGNLALAGEEPQREILEQYRKAQNKDVQAYTVKEKREFPYLQVSEAVIEPIRTQYLDDIGVVSYAFANGTTLQVKETDFEKNQVRIAIQFGTGQRGEPKPGMSLLAESVLEASGTGTLSNTQLEDALTGSSVSYSFDIDTSRFSLNGKVLAQELELLLQTLYALLKDPGLRKDAYRNILLKYEQMYMGMQNDIRGAEQLLVEPFLAGGNTLFGIPSLDELKRVDLEQIRNWVLPYFNDAALEISVVGDISAERVKVLTGKYFGKLQPRREFAFPGETISFPAGEYREFKINSKLDKSLLVVSWKTQGGTDIGRIRRLSMLASVFEERTRLVVREKLGAVYSPSVYNFSSRFLPDYGFFSVRIVTDISQIEKVKEVVLEIAEDLHAEGVEEDELVRVKRPALTSLNDMLQTNGYWLNTVLSGATLYPEQLYWPTTIIEDNAAITKEELSGLAGKYLSPQKAAVVIVRPANVSAQEQ